MINRKFINDKLREIEKKAPLIHVITNPISINQCANGILALGAKPIMAEHPKEVEDITISSKAVNLNLGNITDTRMKSMIISAITAKKNNIPVAIDLVGVACSKLRRNFAYKLIRKGDISLIKGNYSEIMALFDDKYSSEGVDTNRKLSRNTMLSIVSKLSLKYDAIILATGKIDIIADGNKTICITNGTDMLSKITGSGCLLGCLCAVFLTVCTAFEAASYACILLGLSAEFAISDEGNGEFLKSLLDKISLFSTLNINDKINAEGK